MRVASLLPSSTEIACALGARELLVGRSHECDFPTDVSGLPVLTSARLDAAAGSREIDRSVRELVERGLSLYGVDAERLRALRPDVILTQTLCEVCAVTPRDLEEAVRDWVGGAPEVVSLAPNLLSDVWDDVRRTASALGVEARGAALVRELDRRVASIRSRAADAETAPPRVVCLEWLDPLMGCGNWIPELVRLAGGEEAIGAEGEHAAWLEWDALQAADPDVIALLPCGFGLARTRAEAAVLASDARWRELRAVRNGRVYALEGNQYFNRPGPRLVESIEILFELLHPKNGAARHRGGGWQPLDGGAL